MELKDDVFYVTPDGQAIQGKGIRNFVVKVRGSWESIKELIRNAATKIIEYVKEFFNMVDSEKKQSRYWDITWNTMRKSQVMNRKPLFIHARSNL